MKAKTPDKIYLEKVYPDNGVLPNGLNYYQSPDDIEYTRTDAFIEKSFEFFGEHLWEYIDVKNVNCGIYINIDGDKLKEDFKNYMKGG